MTHYLNVSVYEKESPLYHGDQVLVHHTVWREFDEDHEGTGPMFVEVGEAGSGAIARLRPATVVDGLGAEECRMPEWLWLRVGAPIPGEGWVQIQSVSLPMVAAITLRARCEADLLALDDPVTVLSEQISAAWACVTAHSELVLPCGVFDIMGLRDPDGSEITAGCVLNTDVNLDLVPALDHKPPRQPTPMPSPVMHASNVMATDEAVFREVVSTPTRHADHVRHAATPHSTPVLQPKGFIPFSGTGYRLGSN